MTALRNARASINTNQTRILAVKSTVTFTKKALYYATLYKKAYPWKSRKACLAMGRDLARKDTLHFLIRTQP